MATLQTDYARGKRTANANLLEMFEKYFTSGDGYVFSGAARKGVRAIFEQHLLELRRQENLDASRKATR